MGAITVVDFKRVGVDKIFRFSHDTVAATENTGETILPVPKRGVLKWIKVLCPTSLDFDFTLYGRTGVTYPDKDVHFYVTTCNVVYNLSEFEIPYYNNDDVMANKLYFYLVNQDAINSTGVIIIELGINQEGNDRG